MAIGAEAIPYLITERVRLEKENVSTQALDEILKSYDLTSVTALLEILLKSTLQDEWETCAWIADTIIRKNKDNAESCDCMDQIVDLFIELLNDGNEQKRIWASDTIGRLGKSARKAIPTLVKCLDSESNEFGRNSAFALGRIGEDSLPSIQEVFLNGTSRAKLLCLESINKMGMVKYEQRNRRIYMPGIVNILKSDENLDVLSMTLFIIGLSDLPEEGVPAAILAFRKLMSIQKRREFTFCNLIHLYMGPNNHKIREAFIPEMIARLLNRNESVHTRSQAIQFLGRCRSSGVKVVPPLIEVLREELSTHRSGLVSTIYSALGTLGRGGEVGISPLLDICLKHEAVSAVVPLGELCINTINPLLVLLKHDNPKIRAAAANEFRKREKLPQVAIPAFHLLLNDNAGPVRAIAAEVLGRAGINKEATIMALNTALADSEPRVRFMAALSLYRLGEDPEPLVPFCTAALKDKEYSIRERAAKFFGSLGPMARAAAIPLARVMSDPNVLLPKAAWALGEIGCKDTEVIQALEKAAKHENFNIRVPAEKALLKLTK